MDAYSAFHNYSIGNQILAIMQCQLRGLEPGPINTFPGWQALGRNVKRGERPLTLCMPITRKVCNEETSQSEGDNEEHTFTSFVFKPRWFAVSQTVGEEFTPPRLPEWDAKRAFRIRITSSFVMPSSLKGKMGIMFGFLETYPSRSSRRRTREQRSRLVIRGL